MSLSIAVTGSFCSEVLQTNEAGEWTAEISEGSMLKLLHRKIWTK